MTQWELDLLLSHTTGHNTNTTSELPPQPKQHCHLQQTHGGVHITCPTTWYHSDPNCTATYTRPRLPTRHGARYLPVGCHYNPNCTATLNRHRLSACKLQVVEIQLQTLYHMSPHDLPTHVSSDPPRQQEPQQGGLTVKQHPPNTNPTPSPLTLTHIVSQLLSTIIVQNTGLSLQCATNPTPTCPRQCDVLCYMLYVDASMLKYVLK